MEIADRAKERSTLILAVLTLVVIGVTVLLSTRQTFSHQREAEEQHLFLTSRAVFLSIESSVRRGPVRGGERRLSPRTAEFFQTLEQDGDVLFVALVDDAGENMLTSPLHGATAIDLPDAMVDDMVARGEWHGRLNLGGKTAYVYGKRLAPMRGMHMSLRDELGPPGFLVVGIDMEKHLAFYAGFRRNVIFQTLYILAAAILTWGLGWGLLKRRDQAGKAAALERFQAKLLDNLPDGLITLDSGSRLRSVNPAALSILKLEAANILGRGLEALPAPVARCIAEKDRADESSRPLAPEGDRADSGWRSVNLEGAQLEMLSLPLAQDSDNARMLIIRDRTKLRNLEKSLAETEKLAAVGALAAGVAHEVRNPLSSLRGFAQYFVKKLSGRQPEEEYAKTMVREADRLNRVITDLLFLGRPRAIQPQRVDLAKLCAEIMTLLRFDLEQKGVMVCTKLEWPFVQADPDALKQALLNLLLNSLDALDPAAGSLRAPAPDQRAADRDIAGAAQNTREAVQNIDVEADFGEAARFNSGPDLGPGLGSGLPLLPGHERMPLLPGLEEQLARPGLERREAEEDDPWRPPLPDPAGPRLSLCSGLLAGAVHIDVQDLGRGMTRAQQKKAFEAFFTDKEHGTGLGLALVRRTMLDHGGAASISSAPGRGCTVRLVFPGAAKDAGATADAGAGGGQ
ncbi:PAS domain-containing protein [Desulfovibrio sp. OttesenSCG-928-G11]|nr:PAS domain-containing protein [Desulfovibrio sp. OttesenSCG-928-G11]